MRLLAAILDVVHADVETSEESLQGVASTASDHEIVLEPLCGLGHKVVCDFACDVDDAPGLMVAVWVDGGRTGTHCRVIEDEADARVTLARVLREFRRLEWPKSELIILSPRRKKLVNLVNKVLGRP